MPAYSKLACLAPLAMAAGAEAFVPAPAAVPSLRGSSVAAVAPKNLGLRVGAKSRGLASLNMVTTLPPGVPGFTTMQKGYFDPTGFDVLKEFEKFAEEAGIEGMDSVLEKLEAQESERMLSIAQSNFKRWNDALQTKDPKKVAELYSSGELSFLPTVSPKHITDTTDTEQYFVDFVLKNPFGTITDESVQAYGNAGDAYLHSGMYTFELGDADNRTPVQARFSYVWQKVGGEWKISHHHSSVRPPVPVSAAEMKTIAQTNFKRWNDALQTKDPKKVAALYSSGELSFLPTVSPEHITGTADTEQYFVNFVLKNPFGTITDESVQAYGPAGDAYLHSGMYTFELGDAGARTPVQARFSYVWQKQGNEWKISHHHSSVRPPVPVSAEEWTSLAQTNFKKWNDSLQTKDPKKVAALYSSGELSFLPTVSPAHITDTANTEQYFVNFVLKNPFGTITDESVQPFGSDAYLHSGQYTFELGDAGARTPVEARFSYVWKKVGDEWKISHHHSSVRPPTPVSQEEMTKTAQENFKKWNDSLQTKDPKKVAALYSDSALSFLPTVSPKHITDTKDTEQYFVNFVLKNPFGTITDESVQAYGSDAYLHSGQYTFELGDAGARTPVEARFSYMWTKSGDEWKIAHHHSSVRPE